MGDQPAHLDGEFDEFYRLQYPALVALLERILSGAQQARAVAHQAIGPARRQWHEGAADDNPEISLRTVAIGLAVSRRRGRAEDRLRAVRQPPAEFPLIDENDARITGALAALPLKQRAAVALHYLEGRPVDQIADVLGCADSVAQTHLHRGRKALFEALGAGVPGEVW